MNVLPWNVTDARRFLIFLALRDNTLLAYAYELAELFALPNYAINYKRGCGVQLYHCMYICTRYFYEKPTLD